METPILPEGSPMLEWRAPQHLHHTRTKLWYVCAAVFVLLCIGYSIWTRAWTFTFMIVIVSTAYWKLHDQKPSLRRIRLWKEGFAIGDSFTKWQYCTGYWILKGGDNFELYIERNNGTIAHMNMGRVDPYLLNEVLPSFLPHLPERRESAVETIIRICKL